jgi:arginase family enzyme
MTRYGPPDAFEMPRFSGPRTFMRLPHVRELDGVDVAVVGIPTDGAVAFRSGARFGPEGIRSASVMLRNYNPLLRVDVVEKLSLVDYGDVPTVPGSTATRSSGRQPPSRRSLAPGSRPSVWAGTTQSCSRSSARSRPCTDRWP